MSPKEPCSPANPLFDWIESDEGPDLSVLDSLGSGGISPVVERWARGITNYQRGPSRLFDDADELSGAEELLFEFLDVFGVSLSELVKVGLDELLSQFGEGLSDTYHHSKAGNFYDTLLKTAQQAINTEIPRENLALIHRGEEADFSLYVSYTRVLLVISHKKSNTPDYTYGYTYHEVVFIKNDTLKYPKLIVSVCRLVKNKNPNDLIGFYNIRL